MDFWAALAEKLASLFTSQAVINAAHAVFGGLVGAISFGRKHPFKLITSAALAGLFGYMLGGATCEIFLEMCTIRTFKAFSFGLGFISWPIFLLLPQLVELIPELARKWVSRK